MQYRKIGADKIFTGHQLLENHVLVLAENGMVEAVIPSEEAGEDVERMTGLLTPGFVNCHCHLELSHMRGKIPEGTGLVDFVFKVVTERSASEEEIQQAIATAELEMANSGIVAVGDICNNTSTLPQKQKRKLRYYNFIEASGWLPSVSDIRFERATQLFKAFSSSMPDCSIVPHAPYSVSENLWAKLASCFAGKVVSIHNQETAHEDEFFLKGTGDFKRMYEMMKIDNSHHVPSQKSSLQSYFDRLREAGRIILVHNTFITREDIAFVKERSGQWPSNGDDIANRLQPFFCLCVNANQYIENTLPPLELLRQNGCLIVLGTDSLASNWSLRIGDEIKAIRKHFPHIPLEEILGWATLNGARALNMTDHLGSFEKGKKPGVVLCSEDEVTTIKVLAPSS